MPGRRKGSVCLFNKIDPVVLKETRFIAAVVLILTALMQAVFLILGQWDYTVLLGGLWGAALAVLNFFLMGMTIAKAVTLEQDKAKKKIQLSQQLRLLMLLVGCVIGAALPVFHTIAVLVPQFFPRIGVAIRGLTLKKGE